MPRDRSICALLAHLYAATSVCLRVCVVIAVVVSRRLYVFHSAPYLRLLGECCPPLFSFEFFLSEFAWFYLVIRCFFSFLFLSFIACGIVWCGGASPGDGSW